MPTLNQGSFIERSIRSVVSQMNEHIAFVVVDGGSQDQTHAVLDRYASHVTEVIIEPGCSQAEALAIGYNRYQGQFAGYLNSDDCFIADGLTLLVNRMKTSPNKCVAVYGNRIFVDEQDRVTGVWNLPAHSSYLMQRWDYIPQEACLWSYAAMEQVGGINTSLDFALDYDLFVRLMQAGSVQHFNEYVATFRVHERSKTQTLNVSLGQTEVKQIQQTYGISSYPWDRALGYCLRNYVSFKSRCSPETSLQARIDEALRAEI